jgi:F-type H+-transporting ATPase subunit epsilon
MATFLMNLVSPERLLFAEPVEQADLPGTEGDFGVLSGHAPIVAVLRPGVVTAIAGSERRRYIVLGGLAEFSNEALTVLAESATAVEEFDVARFRDQIEEMQQALAQQPAGDEFDKAVARLDHYRSIHTMLTVTSPF